MVLSSLPLHSLLTRRRWQRPLLSLTLLWCLVWLLTSTNLVTRAPPLRYDLPGSHEDEVDISEEILKELHSVDLAEDRGGIHDDNSEDRKLNDLHLSREMAGGSKNSNIDESKRKNDHIGDGKVTFFQYRIEQKSNVTFSHIINPYSRPAKYNIAYIKMIKCASETVALLFYRFGYMRDLSFVLPPPNKLYLGWPYQLEEGFYRPSGDGRFNILCDHAVYNEARFDALMPNDTVYITSIREPFAQVRSMFSYYNLASIVGLDKHDPNAFREYMSNLEHYEGIYKSSEHNKTRFCVPDGFSMTRNLMSFNLGFPTGWDGTVDRANSTTVINQWLTHISKKYELVMIVEHFIESLILLKRQLLWTWKDILHTVQNVGNYNKTNLYQDQALIDVYKQWSRVDYTLYEHFNKTLWYQISKQGNQFHEEVAAFKDILKVTKNFCASFPDSPPANGSSPDPVLYVDGSLWDAGFVVDSVDCTLLRSDHMTLMNQLALQYTTRHAGVRLERKLPPRYVC